MRALGACLLRSIGVFALCACMASTVSRPTPVPETNLTANTDPKTRPRLVVAVVFDQLGSDTLARHLPLLDEQGAIRRAIREGYVASHVRYVHATSLTAPNHAAIHTGAVPRVTGITGNRLRKPGGETRTSIDNGKSQVFDAPEGTFAGPDALRVDTLSDRLKKASGGAAKTVSVSLKDRAAILSGGQHPDAAIWYEPAVPGFTTSTHYEKTLPRWLRDFRRMHPLDALLSPWIVENPGEFAARLGPDDGPGEGRYLGWSTVFPHDPRTSQSPYGVLRLTPSLTALLLDLAEAAVAAYDVGTDDVTDLLAISISGTDYVGHVFGPDSWEYVDHLRKADRMLGALITRLAAHTPLALLITSDHGVARLPEKRGDDATNSRVPAETLADAARREIARELQGASIDASGGVERFAAPYLYLTPAGRDHKERARIVAAAMRGLLSVPGTHAVYDAARMPTDGQTGLERDVGAAIHPDAGGDVYVVHNRHVMSDIGMVEGSGTTHGSPWDYDRTVPALAWGAGVTPGKLTEPTPQPRVTSTLAKLLGIPPPQPNAPPPFF